MGIPLEQEFDFDSFSHGTKIKEPEKKERKTVFKKVKPVKKTKAEEKKEHISVFRRIFKVAVIALVFGLICAVNVYVYSSLDSIDREINAMQKKYDLICAENAELSMALGNMVSVEQIEKAAVEKLGLVKINSADIEYVRTVGESSVLVASGEQVD